MHENTPPCSFVLHWLSAVLLPSLGVLPFFIPLSVNEDFCGGSGSGNGSVSGRVAQTLCAELDTLNFICVTGVWWLGTLSTEFVSVPWD